MGNNYTNILARASINNLVDAVHATFMPVSVINRSAGIIKIYVYILLFILLFIFVFGIEVDLISFFFFSHPIIFTQSKMQTSVRPVLGNTCRVFRVE